MGRSDPPDVALLHPHDDEPHLLREVIRTYQVLIAGFAREIGMPASKLAVLRLLAVTDGGVGVMDLARILGVNAAAVTRQLQDLERSRLIRRRADPRDGRRQQLSLSAKGQCLFAEIHERGHALERSLSALLSADEFATATTVLTKLRTFMEGLGENGHAAKASEQQPRRRGHTAPSSLPHSG